MQQLKEKRLLCVCGDAGGAAAIAPVISRLSGRGGVQLQVLAYGPGQTVLAREGIRFGSLPGNFGEGELGRIFQEFAPSAILCGTSVNAWEWEKSFIRRGRQEKTPTMSVLDFWSAYDRRFGSDEAPMSALPDRVAVMDAQAREGMLKAGCPPERIIITGQPAFDRLAALRDSFTDHERTAVRTRIGVSAQERLIVFFSQPIRSLVSNEDEKFPSPGYDEWKVLDLLSKALIEAGRSGDCSLCLVVQPHPRDANPAQVRSGPGLRIQQGVAIDSHSLMMAADLVVGMTTVALVEACYLGAVTVSLQPEAVREDMLPTNRMGLSRGIYRSEEISQGLREMLLDTQVRTAYSSRLREFKPDGAATERICDELLALTGEEF